MTSPTTIEFNKYHKYGAYHWKWYKGLHKHLRYIAHVNRLKSWVLERNTLEIGAGDGLITHILGIKGIDNEPKAIELAEGRGANVSLGDAHKTAFDSDQFDSVLMADTLEHLENPEKALKEARRILKSYLYVAVPVESKQKEIYQYEDWNPSKLKDIVESQGFKLIDEILVENRKIYGKFKKV